MIHTGLLFYCLLGMVVLTTPVQAAQVDDIRVLIDVSGSMVKTDPHNLRVPALRMINGLLQTGSRAGVWTFGRYVNMEVKWGTVNDLWRQQADEGAAKIHSRGKFTNIESALKRTTSSWKKPDPNTRRNIILLTDGQVDISNDSRKNALSKSNIVYKIVPQLVEKGIKVHAISLSGHSDEELLKRIALATSGSFEIANSAEDLQRIFLRMFERAAKPDTVPLKGNKFTIDGSIREMTLLVFQKGDKKTQLIQPDGISLSEAKHGSSVRWRNDQGYDLITIKKPTAGEWILDADVDPDNRVMIVTDLKLMVEKLPAYSTPDQDVSIKVELHNKNKKISKNSFLKFVDFNVNHKTSDASVTSPLNLKKSREVKDKGIYLHPIKAPLSEGSHEFVINADARTFNRSKRFRIEVQWPVIVEIKNGAAPGENRLVVKAREEYILPDSLQLSVKLQLPDGEQQPVELKQLDNQWAGILKVNRQDGLHLLHISMKAISIDGTEVSHTLDGYSVLGVKIQQQDNDLSSEKSDISEQPSGEFIASGETESHKEEQDTGLAGSLIIIGVINIVIILLAGGAYYYLRKKKSQDAIDLMEEEEEGGPDD